MNKQNVINSIEDAVTDMEYRHFINPDFDLGQKWSITNYSFIDDYLDTGRIRIKEIKKDRGIIIFNPYADEFEKTIIYKGKEFKEKREVEFQIFYNLDTDSVNVFAQFYYAPTRKFLEIIYDTAKQSVEDIIDDYYSKLSSFLKNEETEKNRINNRN